MEETWTTKKVEVTTTCGQNKHTLTLSNCYQKEEKKLEFVHLIISNKTKDDEESIEHMSFISFNNMDEMEKFIQNMLDQIKRN